MQQRPQTQEWTGGDAPSLIDHILEVYHRPLDEDIPRLEQLSAEVASAHGDRHPHLLEVRDRFRLLVHELQDHMAKEENVLFPMIRAGAVPEGPVFVMRHEHDEAVAQLRTLRALCTDYVPPEEADGDWPELYAGLQNFERDLLRHIHLENEVLFPMLDEAHPV